MKSVFSLFLLTGFIQVAKAQDRKHPAEDRQKLSKIAKEKVEKAKSQAAMEKAREERRFNENNPYPDFTPEEREFNKNTDGPL